MASKKDLSLGEQDCTGSNNLVYRESGLDTKSKYVHFYYLEEEHSRYWTQDSHFSTRTYFITLPRAIKMDPAQVHRLILSADLNLISPIGWKVADLRWRKKAHLVFVLRDRRNKLRPCDAVTFAEGGNKQNHSFRDGKDIYPIAGISGMYCFNIRKNKYGKDIDEKDDELYEITVNTDNTFPNNHQDNGQNTGP